MAIHAPLFCLEDAICDELGIAASEIDEAKAEVRGFAENGEGVHAILTASARSKGRPWESCLVHSRFDAELRLVSCEPMPAFEKELMSAWTNRDSSLLALPSGELVYSTAYNRTWVFDALMRGPVHSYNAKLEPALGEDLHPELNVEGRQAIFDANLFMKGALCPDTGRMLVLMDALCDEGVSMRKMYGEVIALSTAPITSLEKAPAFEFRCTLHERWPLLHRMNANVAPARLTRCVLGDGSAFDEANWSEHPSLSAVLKESFGLSCALGIWCSFPVALGEGLFLLPLFSKLSRSGSRGSDFCALLMDSAGDVRGRLEGLDLHEDSPYQGDHFVFASLAQTVIYKNHHALYAFAKDGRLLEKHRFDDSAARPLRPYKLLGTLGGTRAVFVHPKNNELFAVDTSEGDSLLEATVSSLAGLRKGRAAAKKAFDHRNRCWFPK